MVLACVVQPPHLPLLPPICDTPLWRSARRGFDPLQIRNRAEIIFLMCEHKPHPDMVFRCRCKTYLL